MKALVLLLSLTAVAQSPDTIYFHGDILTGAHLSANDAEPAGGRVASMALLHGKVLKTGSDADILALQSPQTKLVDLHNTFVMPGFNDAHTHMAFAGQQHLTVDLDNIPSLAVMQAKVKAYAATLPPGAWIRGGGWDQTKWASKTLPTAHDLDAVTGGHPALIARTDGHMAVANSAALAAAGITSATASPAGSQIDQDAQGQPTGILREDAARALVEKIIPPLDTAMRRKALLLSIQDAISHGVTSVQDFSDWDDWLVLESLEREHKLPLRFAEWIAFNLPLSELETRRASHDTNDPLLHLTMLKAFMDGSLGSRTASLERPYLDDPGNSGLPRYDQQKLNEMSAARAADGFQLGFHAIGDKANNMALDAFAEAEKVGRPADFPPPSVNPNATIVTPAPRAFRFRIEHAQVVTPDAFHRFHELGVIASMQPSHLITDMAWARARLGPERSKYAYAWKSFLDNGVLLAFGTDYPVESINPFRGLYASVTRQNEDGTQTFEPQERITLNEALYAYTQGSAFAEFREHLKGRLAPGYVADFILLDRDITKASPQELLHTRVLETFVNGQSVYIAPKIAVATTMRRVKDDE